MTRRRDLLVEPSRCKGCDALLSELFSFPARSRFGHGDLCSDCGRREAFEGDFILRAWIAQIADRKPVRHS